MVDFAQLLDTQASSAERPKPKPEGDYTLLVTGHEMVESQKKGTPGVQFSFKYVMAHDNVDQAALADVDLSKGSLRDTFWLTDDSMYRLSEFIKKCGVDAGERTFGELLPETTNCEIVAAVSVEHNLQRPDSAPFNNIKGYRTV